MKTNNDTRRLLMALLLGALIVVGSAAVTYAADVPGTVPQMSQDRLAPSETLGELSATSLGPVVTETGLISLSLDALGVDTNVPGTIHVDKPAGATVRAAYLVAADVWGQMMDYPIPLPDGAVQLNGTPVVWSIHVKLYAAIGGPNHAWADVTPIVKPVVDAAPAGIVDLTVVETMYLDGSILAVIFDDPNETTINTVILLFGAQSTTGDAFNILLAEPIDLTDPNLGMDFSLGIAYGYQEFGGSQRSEIDVNGQRITSSAGGEDDGYHANGGLITVGGIGDSNANPADPYALPANERTDDELYSLLPFVTSGDTQILVNTLNPSNDDSIFLAALFIRSAVAIVGEGIILEPLEATNEVGTEHTVTATVQDDAGDPVVGREVTFTIQSGPHAGLGGVGITDVNGQVSFSYTGTDVGTDVIVASFVDSSGDTITSNRVTKEWISTLGGYCTYTMGGWGSKCPAPQQGDSMSTQPGCIRDHYFTRVFPNGVVIGDPDGPDDDEFFAAKWSTAAAVQAFLPGGSTPMPLDDDLANPEESPAGVLGGQLLALHLNVAYSCAGIFDLLGLMPVDVRCYSSMEIDEYCGRGIFDGMSVGDFLAFADSVVGGLDVLPTDVTYSDVNQTATCLNESFEGCRPDGPVATNPGPVDKPEVRSDGGVGQPLPAALEVSATHLAASGSATISFALPVDSKVTVDIYDISGRLVIGLLNQHQAAGRYSINWNGSDASAKQVVAGVYFCRVTCCDGLDAATKMIKIR